MSIVHLYGTTRHERRLLTACARCGPIPVQVAHCYHYVSHHALEAMRERGLVQACGAYPISPSRCDTPSGLGGVVRCPRWQ